MDNLTVEELQENFEVYMDRVKKGESFLIQSEQGNFMLIPYDRYDELDELVRIHTDHEEGS